MLSRIEHAMNLTEKLRSLPAAEPRRAGWDDVQLRLTARTRRARDAGWACSSRPRPPLRSLP